MGTIQSIKFSNQSLLYSNRICCFNNDSAEIKYQFDEDSILTLIFKFNYDSNIKETTFNIDSPENGIIVLNLYNFSNALGSGTIQPINIAKYKGKQVSIVFFVYKMAKSNPILDFSLYLEN